ncbi:MAG: hypothetical protein FWC67_03725, partial [Defluviitaleaceae bacterium]|nr:hypothetical protein [Defluviitaleaceae bacterium]
MKNRLVKRFVSLCVTVLLLMFFLAVDALWMLEYRVQDAVFQRVGVPHPDIVVIGIDDHALDTFGAF